MKLDRFLRHEIARWLGSVGGYRYLRLRFFESSVEISNVDLGQFERITNIMRRLCEIDSINIDSRVINSKIVINFYKGEK